MEGSYSEPLLNVALAGMQIGPVYRLRITDIPNHPGLELFPTIEVLDRLYPPQGLALRYPIPVELTQDELELAVQNMFVTRVIYIEDPSLALPVRQQQGGEQPWMEARPGDDPLVAADSLGRPVAILRIGGRVPNDATVDGGACPPPLILYNAYDACPLDCPPLEPIPSGTALPEKQLRN
jgi:hypothetical protein